MTENTLSKAHHTRMTIPERVGDAVEINYGQPPEPDFGPWRAIAFRSGP